MSGGLALFGWLVLVALAAFGTVATLGMCYVSAGFTGRVSPLILVYAVPTAVLWGLAWWTCPLTIGLVG